MRGRERYARREVALLEPLTLVDLELSRPPDPALKLDAAGVQALLRWHGRPLGWVTRGPGNGSRDPADLTRSLPSAHASGLLRHRLRAALQAPRPSSGLRLEHVLAAVPDARRGPLPLVTVAVCTRDRAGDLPLCLDALVALDYPALDLLVVDNAPSTEATARLVAVHYPRVRYVREPSPGLNWARNRAVREARGEILAFTDDDAVVDPGWVTALVRVFGDDPDVMAVTGLVVPYELQTEAQHLFERYGGFGRGYEREWHSVGHRTDRADTLHLGAGVYGTGANMAYRLDVFARIGEFDPALDVGTVTDGGGDLDMFLRVLHHGQILVYEPAAIVRHRHRRTRAELRRQIIGWGSGFYAYLTRNARMQPGLRGRLLRFGLWYFWRRYVVRLLRSALSSSGVPPTLVLAELRGALAGPWRYRRARAVAACLAGAPARAVAR